MKLKTLLQLGYFPKELPPPFQTLDFGSKARYINAAWEKILANQKACLPGESSSVARKRFTENYIDKYGSSQLLTFSIPKGIYSRRKLSIPHPKQFSDLARAIVDNWQLIHDTHKISIYSQSTPVEDGVKRSVRTKSKSWNNFKFGLIEKSFAKKVELRLDISQFYASIYTHSIPWSILGKEDAKKYFKIKSTQKVHWDSLLKTDEKAQNYRTADYIDTLVRNCNERQSIGFPIGPDSSFILAEVIGNRLDKDIFDKLDGIEHTGVRYYDDYYFYLNNYDDAEKVLKIVQQVLHEYNLETNENKINIQQLPFESTEGWAIELSNFKFDKIDRFELRNFFSILNKLLEQNRKHTNWVVHYALGRYEYGYVKIKKDDWQLFLSLILQTLIIDPSNINQIFKIILSYKSFITPNSKQKIGKVLELIIKDHLILNHSFEVSWSLWIFKSLKIKCPSTILNAVLSSNDSISRLICLDIIHSKLFTGRKPGLSRITKQITSASLYSSDWLFVYESYKKKWLDFKGRKLIKDHEFLNILYSYDISFYNRASQVKINFDIKPNFTFSDNDFAKWLKPVTQPKKKKKMTEEDFDDSEY